MLRAENDIIYSWSNDLTDRQAADKVFADEALGRVTVKDSILSRRFYHLGSDKSQD